MQGEDYRSQALRNYEKILELQEVVLFLQAEPTVWRDRNLALKTQLRRDTERWRMKQEETR